MALDPHTEATLALHRFGFGPRAGTIDKMAPDPRGALLAELEQPGAGAIVNGDLLTSAEAAQAGREARGPRARRGQSAGRQAAGSRRPHGGSGARRARHARWRPRDPAADFP